MKDIFKYYEGHTTMKQLIAINMLMREPLVFDTLFQAQLEFVSKDIDLINEDKFSWKE